MGEIWAITGGTGTLGAALAHRLLADGHRIRTYSRNEHSIEALVASLPPEHLPRLTPIMGAVEDPIRLGRALDGVDILVHAAAQKIIPIAEFNPIPCVTTNILGTANVIEAAIKARIKRAVLVSSDKARAPSTLYGATKLCAERLWMAANRYRGGRGGVFFAAAWGNVWGSRGSVLHAWAKQAQFGHLEITDPQMTRFHIRLHEAVDFLLRTVAGAEPETLWIPKLPSYRLGDLAEAFGRVYELPKEPVYTGRRGAEKLHEELVSENETPSIREETGTHFVLSPGKALRPAATGYTSGSNTWRLGIDALEQGVREWTGLS